MAKNNFLIRAAHTPIIRKSLRGVAGERIEAGQIVCKMDDLIYLVRDGAMPIGVALDNVDIGQSLSICDSTDSVIEAHQATYFPLGLL